MPMCQLPRMNVVIMYHQRANKNKNLKRDVQNLIFDVYFTNYFKIILLNEMQISDYFSSDFHQNNKHRKGQFLYQKFYIKNTRALSVFSLCTSNISTYKNFNVCFFIGKEQNLCSLLNKLFQHYVPDGCVFSDSILTSFL